MFDCLIVFSLERILFGNDGVCREKVGKEKEKQKKRKVKWERRKSEKTRETKKIGSLFVLLLNLTNIESVAILKEFAENRSFNTVSKRFKTKQKR